MEYFITGQQVRLTHTVYSDTGILTNATTITLTITQPDGTTAGPFTPTNVSTGQYRYDYTTTQAGRHTYRWTTTGPVAPDDGSFDVHSTTVGIVSLEDAKAHLNIPATTTTHDEELRRFIASATQRIERHADKVIVRRTDHTLTSESYATRIKLWHRPILSLTSIATVDGITTWNVGTSYVYLDSADGVIRVLSGSYWTGDLIITYVAGMSVVPDEYSDAALEIIASRWNSQRQPGIGPNPFVDQEDTAAAGPMRVSDARLTELLGPPPPMVA